MSEPITCPHTGERGRISRPRSRSGFRRPRYFVPRLERLDERLTLDATSAGDNGINAANLLNATQDAFLDGSGIGIGQVETGRPYMANLDVNGPYAHDVTPTAVYRLDGAAGAGQDITPHAVNVAGIMISNGNGEPNGLGKGIVPNARLYSSAVGQNALPQDVLRAMQHVAAQQGYDVRAINLSYGPDVPAGAALDGSSLLTLGLDWAAYERGTLFVVAGNENATTHFPTDEFNGLTVAATRKFANENVYRQVDSLFNDFSLGANGRRLVDLVAPGVVDHVPTTTTFPNINEPYGREFGTSIAAPHVTAAAAMLQQDNGQAKGLIATRPLVIKAVLMNSADKVEDDGTGNYLGMDKTILRTEVGGTNWLSPANDARDSADNPNGRSIPLDRQMGAGQLNVGRALEQYRPGRMTPETTAVNPSAIGWDYNAVGHDYVKYSLPTLKGGSYISLTLTWNRDVTLNETVPSNGKYDVGETFTANALENLDLYLMPAGATDINQNLWSSVSTVDNVEHMFYKLSADTKVEIWVKREAVGPLSVEAPNTLYALAWWGVAAPAKVESVAVNDGSAQRSMVNSITVTFDRQVFFTGIPEEIFRLTRIGPGSPTGNVTLAVDFGGSTSTQTVARLTFSGGLTEHGSLMDGNYVLTIQSDQVLGADGEKLDGNGDGIAGGDMLVGLYRYFGDGTGDRFVDGADFSEFMDTYQASLGDPDFIYYYDFDSDNYVGEGDFDAFTIRFGSNLPA